MTPALGPGRPGTADEPPLFTRPFVFLIIAHGLESVGWTSMVLLPLYLDHLGASRVAIGAIIAAARVGGLVSRPIVGWALDVVGRKKTVVVGTVLTAVGMVMIGAIDRVGPLAYIARVVFGVGLGATFAGYFTFAADLIPPSRRTEGIALFGVAGLVMMATGPLIEGAGFTGGDLRYVFVALAAVVLSSLLLLWPLEDGRKAQTPVGVGAVGRAVIARPMWSVWVAGVAFSGLVVLFLAFASVTAERRGISNPSAIWFFYAAGAVGARLLGARLPDRLGPSNIVAPAIGLYVVACFMMATARDPMTFLVVGALAGLAHGYCFPVLTSQVVTRMPDEVRGSAVSTFTFVWDLTAVLVSPALGHVADRSGDSAMYELAGLAALGALVLWAALEHGAVPPAPVAIVAGDDAPTPTS